MNAYIGVLVGYATFLVVVVAAIIGASISAAAAQLKRIADLLEKK